MSSDSVSQSRIAANWLFNAHFQSVPKHKNRKCKANMVLAELQ